MISSHFDAVVALLRGYLPADVAVHDTDASHVAGQASSYPYVVLSGGVVEPFSESIGGCRTEAQALIRVTVAGLSPRSVRHLLDRTRTALDGAWLRIEGRSGWDLVLEDSLGVNVDRDVQVIDADYGVPFPFYAVDIYRIGSTNHEEGP